MRREVLDTARREKDRLIADFQKSIIGELNSRVYEACADVLKALSDKDNLHPRSVVQLKNLVANLDKLNFTQDVEIEEMLGAIKAGLNTATESRGTGLQERLLDIGVITRNTLKEIGLSPRSAREVGIPDAPSLDMVRQARSRLSDSAEIQITLPENGRKARVM